MRAILCTSFGEAIKALEYRTDHPKPVRKPGEVLIAVHATSINPGERMVRKGALPRFMIKIPQILGDDVAGVVLEADSTSKFQVGDRVLGCTGQAVADPWGTYAEFCSVKEERLCLIPKNVSFEQAGALPIAGLTAWQALAPSMPLLGKRVLVHGGAGGIGHYAVQIAKAQGAYVATTCSARNLEFCTKELGADLAIDYNKDRIDAVAGEPYDLVVDLVGAEPESWKLLKRNGRMAAVSWDKLVAGKNGLALLCTILYRIMRMKLLSRLGLCQRYDNVMQAVEPDKGLKQLVELVATGQVTVHIDRVVTLEQIPEAHAAADKGGARGKVVVKVV